MTRDLKFVAVAFLSLALLPGLGHSQVRSSEPQYPRLVPKPESKDSSGSLRIRMEDCEALGKEPTRLHIAPARGGPRPDVRQIKDYPAAFAAILGALPEVHPALDVVRTIDVTLYQSTPSYQRGLVTELGWRPADAPEMARLTMATASRTKILVNQARHRCVPWQGRVKHLAHEVGHLIHDALGAYRADGWFREGFAEWVGYRVLERLGGDPFEQSLNQKRHRLPYFKKPLPRLSDLTGDSAAMARHGGLEAAYTVSFLAVNHLLEQAGVESVVGYFRGLGALGGSSETFRGAFGRESGQFELEFATYLDKLSKELASQSPR